MVSILSAGTFFGALLAAPMGDFLGRKWGIVAASLVFSVGVALQVGTLKMPVFVGKRQNPLRLVTPELIICIVGRVFAGLGVGMMSTLVPMYQSEW